MLKYKINTFFSHKNGFRQFYHIFIFFILLCFLQITLIPSVVADGQDATFDSIEINATPQVQGTGGEIQIEALANFFGGCCYHLFGYNVKAELTVPDNVQILSSLPDTVSKVDAVPGGRATTEKFTWKVASDVPGIYTLEITISTSNCGSHTGECEIRVVEGASISNPTIFPSIPSISEPITFSTEIKSGNELVQVRKATLFVWRSTKDLDHRSLYAENYQLYKIDNDYPTSNESLDDTSLSKNQVGQGKKIELSKKQFTNIWHVKIDDFDKEENIYYWISVETTDDKEITSMVFKQKIEDLEKKYQMLDLTKWGTFLAIALGVFLILGISWRTVDKPAEKIGKTDIFLLGSDVSSKISEGKRSNVESISIDKFRNILILVTITISIIFIIFAYSSGLLQDLITATGG